MKNLKLQALAFGATEILDREQLRNIKGGVMQRTWSCVAIGGGTNAVTIAVSGDNCEQAQANCDSVAYSNAHTQQYPKGGNVTCQPYDPQA